MSKIHFSLHIYEGYFRDHPSMFVWIIHPFLRCTVCAAQWILRPLGTQQFSLGCCHWMLGWIWHLYAIVEMEAAKLICVTCVGFRYIYINTLLQGIQEIWETILKTCEIMKDPRITIQLNLFFPSCLASNPGFSFGVRTCVRIEFIRPLYTF